jgi:hypothetical protein
MRKFDGCQPREQVFGKKPPRTLIGVMSHDSRNGDPYPYARYTEPEKQQNHGVLVN